MNQKLPHLIMRLTPSWLSSMTGEFKDYSIENQVRLYTIPRSDHICGLSAPGYLIILPLNCYICLVFHYLVKVPDLVYRKDSGTRGSCDSRFFIN